MNSLSNVWHDKSSTQKVPEGMSQDWTVIDLNWIDILGSWIGFPEKIFSPGYCTALGIFLPIMMNLVILTS